MTTKKEEKALVETKPTPINVYDPNACYGATDDITAADITIGKILIMQATSDLAKKGSARTGAIINFLDGKEIGFKEEKPLLFIPIKSTKYWVEKDKETKEYLGRFPANDANEKPWEENVNGKIIQRIYNHSFYVILPEEIKTGDAMPLEITFRSTDIATAKKLSLFLFKLKMRGEASWNRTFKLTTQLRQKDKYSWFGTDVSVCDTTTEEQRKVCIEWHKQISSAKNITHVEEEAAIIEASPIPEPIMTGEDIPF